jgi:hypothetical protein
MSTHPDGGQFESTASALITAPDALPCEIDQTKLDPISRLACSTNLSKILKGYPPKRALLDRGPDPKVGVSSNLMRLPFPTRFSALRHFCANLLKLSKLRLPVKNEIHPNQLRQPVRAARSSQRITSAKCARTTRAHRRSLLGRTKACSLRDSLQGFGVRSALFNPTQRTNQLPTSLYGQATRPPGGSTTYEQLSKSSTRHPLLQAIRGQPACLPLQLSEHTRLRDGAQAHGLWKAAVSVGNVAALCPEIGLSAWQTAPNPSAHSQSTAWPGPPAAAP